MYHAITRRRLAKSVPPKPPRRVQNPIVAYRAWRLVLPVDADRIIRLEHPPVLHSLVVHFLWMTRVVESAHPPTQGAPHGLHATKTSTWRDKQFRGAYAVGTVELLGHVAIHQYGYRAERMLVRSIKLPSCFFCRGPSEEFFVLANYCCDDKTFIWSMAQMGDLTDSSEVPAVLGSACPPCWQTRSSIQGNQRIPRAWVVERLEQRYDCEVTA